jgi:retron-type reverse transcriptase
MTIFEQISNFENLHTAYLKARKGKRYRVAILEFGINLEENLLQLQYDLRNDTYVHGTYREFIVHDSKKRHIKAAPFRDRVVHHAICTVIEPIFEKGFIYDSYACRVEKGTHKAVKRLQYFIHSVQKSCAICFLGYPRKQVFFCLKCDISKYFNSVNHEILLRLIRKKIACKRTMKLIEHIVRSDNAEMGTGIPIGNLTSQLFANVYLNELDQFMKRNMQIRYYIRYMDDFLVLNNNKKKLHALKVSIKHFLDKKLRLTLHPKKATISPIQNGIDFLGYLVYKQYRLLRKSTVKRFMVRTRKQQKMFKNGLLSEEQLNASIASWLTYATFGNSWRLRNKIVPSRVAFRAIPS